MHRHFERAHADAGLEFVFREFKHSFRSGENVLAAVDEVFKAQGHRGERHRGYRRFSAAYCLARCAAEPGRDLGAGKARRAQRDRRLGCAVRHGERNQSAGEAGAADRAQRARPCRGGTAVGIERRAARYGDVLVLVRQRGPLFEAIIRALKNENVEVAGADRLVLTEHIAVMDLMALADALLLPQDDLALASVLRSPLFGFSDDDLFAIAWDRGRSSLRAALTRKSAEREIFAQAAARLAELAQAARQRDRRSASMRSFSVPRGGRRRFLARLGAEANDALDEFLNLALDYERRQTPSLQGFVAWLREARAEVKRDMEIARDEVRVMTVHGAKGLEAPIVILADTMTPPSGPRPPRLLELCRRRRIWAGRKDDDVAPVAAARQAALDGSRGRISPALLCRHDACRRSADHLRRRWRTRRGRKAAGTISCVEPLRPFLVEEAGMRRKSLALSQAGGRRYRDAPIAGRASRARRTMRISAMAAPAGARRTRRLQRRFRRPSAFEAEDGGAFARAAQVRRRAPQGAGPRAHRPSADAVVARYSAGDRKDAIERYLEHAAAISLPPSRPRSRGRSSPSSTI